MNDRTIAWQIYVSPQRLAKECGFMTKDMLIAELGLYHTSPWQKIPEKTSLPTLFFCLHHIYETGIAAHEYPRAHTYQWTRVRPYTFRWITSIEWESLIKRIADRVRLIWESHQNLAQNPRTSKRVQQLRDQERPTHRGRRPNTAMGGVKRDFPVIDYRNFKFHNLRDVHPASVERCTIRVPDITKLTETHPTKGNKKVIGGFSQEGCELACQIWMIGTKD